MHKCLPRPDFWAVGKEMLQVAYSVLRLEWCWHAVVTAVLVLLVSATCSRLFSGLTSCILADNKHVSQAPK